MRIARLKRGVLLAVAVVCSAGHFAAEEPVQVIASQRTEVRTPSGVAVVPLDISLDWLKAAARRYASSDPAARQRS